MFLITDLKNAFTHGAQNTLHAAKEDWHSVKRDVHAVKEVVRDITMGVVDGAEGIVTFPWTAYKYLNGTDQYLGQGRSIFSTPMGEDLRFDLSTHNPIYRAMWLANHMAMGFVDIASFSSLHGAVQDKVTESAFYAFVYEHTAPPPTTVRAVAEVITGLAVLCAFPAAKAKGYAALGIPEKAIPVAETPIARQLAAATQLRAEAALQKILAADDAAFSRAWNNTATAGTRGVVEFPSLLVQAWGMGAYLILFRQVKVTHADLTALTHHTNAMVRAAAKQVMAERASPIPEGYMPIPGWEFKGQLLSPFAMKATPVTNGEWFQGVDGRPRFVQLVEDPVTKVIRVKDVMAQPPSSVNPKINFDAGDVAIEGSQILVRLVDNPSAVYDARGRVFSAVDQPAVGVTYYHSQAWVLTDASGRLLLPTDLMQEAVASNFVTAAGRLYDVNGRKLGHFDEWHSGKGTTAAVNDPRYPAGPYGVHSRFNVWRWMQADPSQLYPYGLRGGSWHSEFPEHLRADFRHSAGPANRHIIVGFQPVVLPILPK